MAEQAASIRVTRAAVKRKTASAKPEDLSSRKKRVVLGEIQNVQNVIDPVELKSKILPQKHKTRAQTKVKNVNTVVKGTDSYKLETDAGLEDSQNCSPYASDIYGYLRKMEVESKRRPLPNYIEKIQSDVSLNMRAVLVDWLVEVAEEYKLLSDTLYLSISYIDRFLSLNELRRQKLQLLGVSSMLIASKYEEITPPNMEDFCYITDNTYTKEELMIMEADVLKSLNFEMGNPTTKTFLRKFIDLAQENDKKPNSQLEFLSYYIAELSLLDYKCVKFLPSLVAAAVTFFAKFIIQPTVHPWYSKIEQYSGYKPSELKECVLILHELHTSKSFRGVPLRAVKEKYKHPKFERVSNLCTPSEIPASYFEDA